MFLSQNPFILLKIIEKLQGILVFVGHIYCYIMLYIKAETLKISKYYTAYKKIRRPSQIFLSENNHIFQKPHSI